MTNHKIDGIHRKEQRVDLNLLEQHDEQSFKCSLQLILNSALSITKSER